MDIKLNEKDIMRLAIVWPSARKIYLYSESKLAGELFIQKRTLFYTNLFSAIQRLKTVEVDEIKYSPSDDEVITITFYTDVFILSYDTENSHKEKEMLKLFGN